MKTLVWEEGRKRSVMTKAFECCSVTGQGGAGKEQSRIWGFADANYYILNGEQHGPTI